MNHMRELLDYYNGCTLATACGLPFNSSELDAMLYHRLSDGIIAAEIKIRMESALPVLAKVKSNSIMVTSSRNLLA
jgi:hypothetical protein